MKMYFKKQEPRIIRYRNYKKFSNKNFQCELKYQLQNLNLNSNMLRIFHKCAKSVLDRIAPTKKKYVRANQSPFVNKKLHRAMNRSRLRNKYLKNRNAENRLAYTKQRSYCVSIFRKEKYNCYNNLNEI